MFVVICLYNNYLVFLQIAAYQSRAFSIQTLNNLHEHITGSLQVLSVLIGFCMFWGVIVFENVSDFVGSSNGTPPSIRMAVA